MTFPAEAVPDGAVFAPHHFYVGVMVAVFGFAFIWRYYPAVGASFALGGTLIMADDVISHAFGVWTPLDYLFHVVILPVIA